MERVLWLQRAAGNRAVATLLGPRQPVVQRLILLPFEKMDSVLVNFAREHVAQAYAGPVVQGETHREVGPEENVVVVAHGNGVSLSNWEDSRHDGYMQVQPDDLAQRLKAILPRNYQGTITLWACQSARPWGHVPGVAEQFTGRVEPSQLQAILETSYIKQLQMQLGLREQQVVGPVGYLTTDRPVGSARVYADRDLKFLGKTVGAADGGMIDARSHPPHGFYDGDEETSDASDEYREGSPSSRSGSEDESGTMEADMEPPPGPRSQAPAFRSKQEYLDYLTSLTPSGSSSRPRSFRERLEVRE